MKIPKDQPYYKKITNVFFALVTGSILLFVVYSMYNNVSMSAGGLNHDQMKVHRAEYGQFINSINAFGELKSASRRSLVAQVSGTITEIYVRPGATVYADTVILSLNNPQLEREYESVKLELDEAKAALEQLNAELSDKELTLQSDVLITEAELNTQNAELEAKEILAGKQIISELELRRERVRLEQSRLKHHLAKQKFNTFKKTKTSNMHVAALRVKGVETLLQIKLADIEALKIKAGMSGVLQSIEENIELGQRLNQGGNIGVVANLDTLYAEVRVSASDAANVATGMHVNLNIKGMPAKGIVNRVAPNVVRNQVQVDVIITSELPVTARPDVEMEASIILENKSDVVVLPRPTHFKAGFPLQLYIRVSPDSFKLQTVVVGLASNNQIEVVSGALPGDELLLVDPEKLNNKNTIKL